MPRAQEQLLELKSALDVVALSKNTDFLVVTPYKLLNSFSCICWVGFKLASHFIFTLHSNKSSLVALSNLACVL